MRAEWVETAGVYPSGQSYIRRRLIVGGCAVCVIETWEPQRRDEKVWRFANSKTLRYQLDAEAVRMDAYIKATEEELGAVRWVRKQMKYFLREKDNG